LIIKYLIEIDKFKFKCINSLFASSVCIDLRYIAAAMSNSSDNNTGTFGLRVTVNDKLAINQVLARKSTRIELLMNAVELYSHSLTVDDEQEQCYEFEAPQLQSHCVQLHQVNFKYFQLFSNLLISNCFPIY
jgi:hypothetical protein